MSKYEPLFQYLSRRREHDFELSFSEVEKIVGEELPDSARCHQAWWANEVAGAHVQAHAWMQAGFKVTQVDQRRAVVRFERNTVI